MLTPKLLTEIQSSLKQANLDGWLLYDFRGLNPIAKGLIGIEGMATRRVFAWVPAEGTPVGLQHAIEASPWKNWPREWQRDVYSGWRTMESWLATNVQGKTVAMEYSPGDAVPYVDRVPAGVLDMVRAAGATVVTSGELVTQFFAVLTPEQVESHLTTAEEVADIARAAFALAGERLTSGTPVHEHELAQFIRDEFSARGMEWDHGPDVAISANAANPHYEPSAERPVALKHGDVLLIDLWARHVNGGIWADQTWVAVVGEPTPKQQDVWNAIRDGRDASLALLRARAGAGERLSGADADDASRNVIEARGYGKYFTHRTGHSIDARDLHGSGPHLDNLESREERALVNGVLFSVEPGAYIEGEFGMRTEVNVVIRDGVPVVTPREIQRELIRL
ncbi:MAG: peptidase [Gemmatimonadetes bacterium]|nr:peptidase [Gemmatimonadota bacterium]